MRKIFNILTWIQIVFFGLFVGSAIGILIWLKNHSSAYLITAITSSVTGLGLGIFKAEKVRRETPKGGFYAHTLFGAFRKRED